MGMVGLDPFQLSVIQASNVDDCKDAQEKQCVVVVLCRLVLTIPIDVNRVCVLGQRDGRGEARRREANSCR